MFGGWWLLCVVCDVLCTLLCVVLSVVLIVCCRMSVASCWLLIVGCGWLVVAR